MISALNDGTSPWALLSIAGDGMLNVGNRLVEISLLETIGPPTCEFSVFTAPTETAMSSLQRSGVPLAVCSGTTLLTERGSEFWKWAATLDAAGLMCAMVGGCFWNMQGDRTDTLPETKAVLSVRDPYSRDICSQFGKFVPFVACPSLLLSELAAERKTGNRLLLGFHRQRRELQVEWFTEFARGFPGPTKVLVQEKYEHPLAKKFAGRSDAQILDLAELRELRDWVKVFDEVGLCVSGRLHQVLPAAALGIPCLFIAPEEATLRDSRLSLLSHLGIPCAVISPELKPQELARLADMERLAKLINELRSFLAGVCCSPPQCNT
jgi:Polysaccharide pyruvyl transferase